MLPLHRFLFCIAALALGSATCWAASASAERAADPAPADASADAKKAQSLLQAAKGKLERAASKGDHREKAIASIDLALAEIAKGPSGAPLGGPYSGTSPLAVNERLSAALKLLVGAKGALTKAASYAKAAKHVDDAIAHVKAALAAG